MKLASVILDIATQALDTPYTYRVPEQAAEGDYDIEVGCAVVVPLGARQVVGFVIELFECEVDEIPGGLDPKKLKYIKRAVSNSYFDEEGAACAQWLSERYIAPLSEGIRISGNIGLLLCGFYPFLTLLLRWLDRPLSRLAKCLHGTKEGVIGPLLSLTNLLSTYEVYPLMNEREKVMNAAFAVGASYALCDHVAFCISEAPNALFPMIVGKLIAGGIGFGVAFLLEKVNHKQSQAS